VKVTRSAIGRKWVPSKDDPNDRDALGLCNLRAPRFLATEHLELAHVLALGLPCSHPAVKDDTT